MRFGWNNSGDLSTMVELGRTYGFDVEVIEDVTPAESADPGSAEDLVADPLRRRWSSTWVRELLDAGDVVQAARVLGRPHRIRGTVVHGDARGRELGFPTANLGPDATGLVPADGVYAGWLRRVSATATDRVLPAAVSIGTNPTFDGVERRVEAYVLDRTDLDLYDQVVVLELVERLRPTLRFDSIDDLVVQMHERRRPGARDPRQPMQGRRPQPDSLCAPSERPRNERARVDMPRRTAQRVNQEIECRSKVPSSSPS